MGTILETIEAFFKRDGWLCSPVEGQPVLWSSFAGENGQWSCVALGLEETDQFAFYSICPVNAQPDLLAATAEFIARANADMLIGNFELDWDTGEIRFKTSIDVEGSGLTVELVSAQVYANVSTMDRYLPGLMNVLYGKHSPAEAIALIETDD
jgi:hypothetical protein